jgi:autoinducer 2-degrading protein
MRLVIWVDFQVKPEEHDTFLNLVLENAAASLADEPGCLQFDVLILEGAPRGSFALYEIYADAPAFEDHLRREHYHVFDKAVTPFVVAKKVSRLRIAGPINQTAAP